MQEEVENRTVNLAISTTKLSGRTLIAAFRKFMQHRANVKAHKAAEKPTGEQSVSELLAQNQGASSIPIDQTDIRGFKKILDKYGVDYAVTRDAAETPPRFIVFFKARDADVLTAAFKEYSASLSQKAEKPSVLAQLKKFKEIVMALPKKVREKRKEQEL